MKKKTEIWAMEDDDDLNATLEDNNFEDTRIYSKQMAASLQDDDELNDDDELSASEEAFLCGYEAAIDY